jgi:hypothetical protein
MSPALPPNVVNFMAERDVAQIVELVLTEPRFERAVLDVVATAEDRRLGSFLDGVTDDASPELGPGGDGPRKGADARNTARRDCPSHAGLYRLRRRRQPSAGIASTSSP